MNTNTETPARDALIRILDYMEKDERRSYEECKEENGSNVCKNHIYTDMQTVRREFGLDAT